MCHGGGGGDNAIEICYSLLIIAKANHWILPRHVIHQVLAFTLLSFREDEAAIKKREAAELGILIFVLPIHNFD